MDNILEKMRTKLQLQYRMVCMEAQHAALGEEVKLALYESREASARRKEYEGSLCSLLHGLAGKKTQTQEQLQRKEQTAKHQLETAKWKLADLERSIANARESLQELKDSEVPLETVDLSLRQGYGAIQGEYLLQMTLPLLEKCRAALEESLELLHSPVRSEEVGRAGNECQQRAGDLATRIHTGLPALNEWLRLCELAPLEPPCFFANPAGFLLPETSLRPCGNSKEHHGAIQQVKALERELAQRQQQVSRILEQL